MRVWVQAYLGSSSIGIESAGFERLMLGDKEVVDMVNL